MPGWGFWGELNQLTKYEELKAVCWGIYLPSISSQTILKHVIIPYLINYTWIQTTDCMTAASKSNQGNLAIYCYILFLLWLSLWRDFKHQLFLVCEKGKQPF